MRQVFTVELRLASSSQQTSFLSLARAGITGVHHCTGHDLFLYPTAVPDRKILVSLIEVAQKLLALNPDAVELFKKANGMRGS